MMYLTHIIAFFLGFISLPLLGYFYNIIQEKKRHDKRVKILHHMPPDEVKRLFGSLNIAAVAMEIEHEVSEEEKLKNELNNAINVEDYEAAAKIEKKLRNLKNGEKG